MTSTAHAESSTDTGAARLRAPAPSIRSLLLKDLARRLDQGEDISSRKLSSVLAKQYGCSRALVIGARRTVLDSGHSRAFDELRMHFAFGAQREPG